MSDGKGQDPTLMMGVTAEKTVLAHHTSECTEERKSFRRTHQDGTASDLCSTLEFYVTLHFCGSFPAEKIHSQNMLKLFTCSVLFLSLCCCSPGRER